VTYRVVVPPHVQSELEQSYRHIAAHAPDRAIDWYNDCLDAIESLREFPMRCPLMDEKNAPVAGARRLVHGDYLVIFVVQHEMVRVIHFVHGARQLPTEA